MILNKFFKRKPQINIGPRTSKVIKDLRAAEWFANVGRPEQGNERVVFVTDWDAAMAAFTSETADHVALLAQSILVKNYHSGNRAEWNDMIMPLREIAVSLWKEKTDEAKSKGRCSAQLSEKAFGEMLLILAYVESSDIPKLKYYDEMLQWYLTGHFPCGWFGDEPVDFENPFQYGKLVVF